MRNDDPRQSELDELLRQVDSLLDEPGRGGTAPDEPDISEYTPPEARREEPRMFYQNAANGYGSQVRNYQNHYGNPQPEPREPSPRYDYRQAEDEYIEQAYSIPAYNADFHSSRRERSQKPKAEASRPWSRTPRQQSRWEQEPQTDLPPAPGKHPTKKPRRKRGCCGCGCAGLLTALALMLALVVGLGLWLFDRPETDAPIGPRKRDTATILICGTDADGTRTDTMMLLYLSGSEKKAGLLSLPRDTYTIATAGYAAKLNSAYGRNDCGEEGMEALLDYVQDIIGYRPDGYVLVGMDTVPQVVDAMGGVDVDVPQTVETDGVVVEGGLQHLDGEHALALLRHRSSYAMADLGRVEVQRLVVESCMKQWVSLSSLSRIPQALSVMEETSLSSLSLRNYLWIGKTLLKCMSAGVETRTLPGYPDYIGGVSYYLLNRQEVADLMNESYNPYQVTIDAADLNIAP